MLAVAAFQFQRLVNLQMAWEKDDCNYKIENHVQSVGD
jgi:hypothetical protein